MAEQRTETAPRRPTPATPYSVSLGTVAGIPLRIHFTFFLLIAWLLFGQPSSPDRVQTTLFVVAIFACVVLHELGHSLVARRYGIPVGEIVLYPIGGVARIEKQPKPAAEFWIALAGPAVNLVIAAILWATLAGRGALQPWDEVWNRPGDYAQKLLSSNILLVVFNLIPAFPMDGGRVLRALLAMRLGEVRATKVAATVGQLLAIVLGLLGLGLLGNQQNLILLAVALFVFIAAGQEAAQFRSRAYLDGVRVSDGMITEFHTLPVGATLGEAQELLIHTTQADYPVMNGEELVGLLSRLDLFRGLRESGPTGYVAGSMQREVPYARPNDELQDLAAEMQAEQRSCTLVMEEGRVVGMVTMENVAELLIVRQIAERGGET